MRDKSILIVEDELIIAKDLQIRLENEGYYVPEICSTGQEALKMARIIKPQVVLIDIQLDSHYEGIRIAEQLRLEYNIPVIYITAHVNKEILERVKLTQPLALLLKPINYTELLTAIEIGLHKHKIESQSRRLLEELQTIIAHSNILKDMKVPICSKCNNIREDNGSWMSMEDYMKKYYNIRFIESFCPNCMEKMYPAAYRVIKSSTEKLEQTSS